MPAPLSSFPCGEEQEAVITIKAFPSATSTRALTECSRAAWTWSPNQHPLIHLFNQVGQIKNWMASSWMTWWIVFASYTNCIGFAKYSNTSLLGNEKWWKWDEWKKSTRYEQSILLRNKSPSGKFSFTRSLQYCVKTQGGTTAPRCMSDVSLGLYRKQVEYPKSYHSETFIIKCSSVYLQASMSIEQQ